MKYGTSALVYAPSLSISHASICYGQVSPPLFTTNTPGMSGAGLPWGLTSAIHRPLGSFSILVAAAAALFPFSHHFINNRRHATR